MQTLHLLFIHIGLLIITSCSHQSSSQKSSNKITITGHPYYPPVSWLTEDNRPKGVAVEITHRIFKELNLPYEIIFSNSWSTNQEKVVNGTIDFIMGIVRNDQRKKYLIFGSSFIWDPAYIFSSQNKKLKIYSIDQLQGKRGAIVKGETWGEQFDRYAKNNLTIQYKNIEEIFKGLDNNTYDYALLGYYPGTWKLEKIKTKNKIVYQYIDLGDNFFSIAVSKKSKYKYLIPQINQLIEKLTLNGELKKIIQKYIKNDSLLPSKIPLDEEVR